MRRVAPIALVSGIALVFLAGVASASRSGGGRKEKLATAELAKAYYQVRHSPKGRAYFAFFNRVTRAPHHTTLAEHPVYGTRLRLSWRAEDNHPTLSVQFGTPLVLDASGKIDMKKSAVALAERRALGKHLVTATSPDGFELPGPHLTGWDSYRRAYRAQLTQVVEHFPGITRTRLSRTLGSMLR
jgi:hypothetical protein